MLSSSLISIAGRNYFVVLKNGKNVGGQFKLFNGVYFSSSPLYTQKPLPRLSLTSRASLSRFSSSSGPPLPPSPPSSSRAVIQNVVSRSPSAVRPPAQRVEPPRSPLPPLSSIPGYLVMGSAKVLLWTAQGLVWLTKYTFGAIRTQIYEPEVALASRKHMWSDIKHELHHYWVGTKLLVAELKTSSQLTRKVGRGEQLTRRERLQLKRSMGDLLRLVPFIIIVVVPFAEFGLPVLLKFFPNFLPSQFEKPELRQQAFKDSLAVKIEMQALLQETLTEMAEHAASSQTSSKEAKSSQQQLAVELDAMRAGETRLPPEAVLRVAALFKDEPSLDSMAHWQLAALSKYVGISPYGTDSMLRQNLKKSFAEIKLDDQDLMREGTAYLNKKELKDACEARGMRAFGLTESQYRSQLDEWLMLAVTKKIPITLLLLSRSFQINNSDEGSSASPQDAAKAAVAAEGLQQTIMSLDSAMVAEARLAPAAAAASGANNAVEKAEIAKQKLLLIEQQNELIKAEAAENEAKASTLKANSSTAASSTTTATQSTEAKAAQDSKTDSTVGVQKVVRMKASDATAAAAAVSKESVAMSSAPASLKALGASFAKERELLAKLRAVREQQLTKKTSGATSTSFLEAQLAKMGEEIEQEAKSKTLAGQLTQADADDDGSITRMELIAALRAASVGDEASQAAALVERLDHEREGSLAIDDVERFLNTLGEKAAAASKVPASSPIAKEKKE